jgi:hypothetical protein
MIASQKEASAESLIPPRPNLGPEPWNEAPQWPAAAGWVGSGLALICLFILWLRRRRRKAASVMPDAPRVPLVDPEGSPGQRLIASSEFVRSALIGAFGPAWGSKTTEEIGDDPTLLGRFDRAEVERLIGFLKSADRVKFASVEPILVDDWEAWATSFVSRLAAGAPSRGTGK